MSSHFDAATLQNLLAIGETLSSAVPGAGPLLTAGSVPLTFSNWCYGDATEIRKFDDDFWVRSDC
jgi:hypothetical protein